MKTKPKHLIAVIAGLILQACSSNLAPADYMKWMNDKGNHLIVEEQRNNFIFNVQYKTPEYVTLIDLGEKADENAFQGEIKKYRGLEYYTLRIGSDDKNLDVLKKGIKGNDSVNINKRLSYFSSGIQNDIKLAVGQDTFPCAIFLFERTYNMTSFDNFILAFDTDNKGDNCDRVFILNDHNLGVGPLKLTISKTDIHKIPNLRMS